MMPTTFVNCQAGERLNARSSRAVYRISVVRENYVIDLLSSLTIRDWHEIVIDAIDRLPTLGGIAFPLSSPAFGENVAVFDVRVGANPGSATVDMLAQGISDGSPWLYVSSVEYFPEVPGFSSGGPDTAGEGRTDTRDQLNTDEGGTLADKFVQPIADTLESAVILAALFGAIYFLSRID